MDLKNITMDDLKAKFATIDKKTLIKFGSGFGAILIFLIGIGGMCLDHIIYHLIVGGFGYLAEGGWVGDNECSFTSTSLMLKDNRLSNSNFC